MPKSGSSIQSLRQAAKYRAYVKQQYIEPTSDSRVYRADVRQQYTEPTSDSSIQNLCQTATYGAYVRQYRAYIRQQGIRSQRQAIVYRAYVRQQYTKLCQTAVYLSLIHI